MEHPPEPNRPSLTGVGDAVRQVIQAVVPEEGVGAAEGALKAIEIRTKTKVLLHAHTLRNQTPEAKARLMATYKVELCRAIGKAGKNDPSMQKLRDALVKHWPLLDLFRQTRLKLPLFLRGK